MRWIALALSLASVLQSADAHRASLWLAASDALKLPAANEDDTPVEQSSTAPWLIRRADAGAAPLVASVIANPMNADNQRRAERDMAAIQGNIEAAQRRAQAEYDRAASEFEKTRTLSAEVQGISLADEGVAGERADFETRMDISYIIGDEATRHDVRSGITPELTKGPAGTAWVITIPPNDYPETAARGEPERLRFQPAEARVYLAAATPPTIESRGQARFRILSTSAGTVVVLRGNEELVRTALERIDWTRVTRP